MIRSLQAIAIIALFLCAGTAPSAAQQASVTLSRDLAEPWVLQLRPAVAPGRRLFVSPSGRQVTETRRTVARPSQTASARPHAPAPQRATQRDIDPTFLPQVVAFDRDYAPGTIIVDTPNRFLYLVLGNGQARRYGVGVGRDGFRWSGEARIGRRAEWPTWTPPSEMIQRQPELRQYAGGMPGGPNNPLGARALYLYNGSRDTMYRIHGTNQPWTIGSAVSSGCIRMRNEDVQDLYNRVNVGARVVVL